TIPFLKQLVLSLPELFPEFVPLLPAGRSGTVHLTRAQCACLVACAYLCVLPAHPGASMGGVQNDQWPNPCFDVMHAIAAPQVFAKQRMFLHYFERLRV